MQKLNIERIEQAEQELIKIGCHSKGIEIMKDKMIHHNIKLNNLTTTQASIIKQTMLSLGGDTAVNKDVCSNNTQNTDIIIIGTQKQIKLAINKLGKQPYELKQIAEQLSSLIS